MSRMNGYDKWLMNGFDDHDDSESCDAYVENEINDPQSPWFPFTPTNWAEACSQLGYPEEISERMDLSKTDVVDAVIEYWRGIIEHYYDTEGYKWNH